MTGAGRFANVLDRKLEHEKRRPAGHLWEPVGTRPFMAGLWEASSRWNLADQRSDLGQAYRPAVAVKAESAPRLTPRQQEALSLLREYGASLGNDFDATQLKSAFRRLALLLHPDRHPTAGPQDLAQLNARFALLCRAYRTLSLSAV